MSAGHRETAERSFSALCTLSCLGVLQKTDDKTMTLWHLLKVPIPLEEERFVLQMINMIQFCKKIVYATKLSVYSIYLQLKRKMLQKVFSEISSRKITSGVISREIMNSKDEHSYYELSLEFIVLSFMQSIRKSKWHFIRMCQVQNAIY